MSALEFCHAAALASAARVQSVQSRVGAGLGRAVSDGSLVLLNIWRLVDILWLFTLSTTCKIKFADVLC